MAARSSKREREAAECQAAIEAMSDRDRPLARRLHEVITSSAPHLAPRLWYKQPAYARDGDVVVFFRGADVDDERYLSLGFSGHARLDDGDLWPTAFAVTAVGDDEAARIAELVARAAGVDGA